MCFIFSTLNLINENDLQTEEIHKIIRSNDEQIENRKRTDKGIKISHSFFSTELISYSY